MKLVSTKKNNTATMILSDRMNKKGQAQANRKFIGAQNRAVDVNIVLGKSSENCRFHGICKIEAAQKNIKRVDSICTATATLFFNGKNNLVFHFHRKNISEHSYKLHFDNDFFIILEPVEIPEFVISILEQDFKIHIGEYPIIRNKDYFEVVFTKKK